MLNPYQPNYYSFYPQQNQMLQPTQMPQQQMPQQQQEIIQNGFVNVPSEAVARNYPVAPGNSLVFKDENLPFIYTKTMGFSQLDRPEFEKFRLVKDESDLQINEPKEVAGYATIEDVERVRQEINKSVSALEREIYNLKKKNKSKHGKEGDD